MSDDRILKRLMGRRVCSSCGEIFNVTAKKPQKDGVCDFCSGALYVRKDDKEETIKERLKVFHIQTEPLQRYYSLKGKFYTVDGEKDLDEVSDMLFKVVEGRND